MTNLINKISDSTKITTAILIMSLLIVLATFHGLREYDPRYVTQGELKVSLYSDECGHIQGVREHPSLCEVE